MSSKANIPLRQLGKDGPMVPAMGFGAMGLTFHYGNPLPDEDIFAILDRAYELGCTFWDTADFYLLSEAAIGRWFKRTGKRDDIFLATKFGFTFQENGLGRDSSPEHCREAFEKSLKALGAETIDLCRSNSSPSPRSERRVEEFMMPADYVHILDDVTPIEKTMEALVELQKQGKIKHIGLSNVSARCLRRAVAIAPVAAMQAEYRLLSREIEGTTGPERNLVSTCHELGVAIVAATPLGRGILTSTHVEGKPLGGENDQRSVMMPRFLGDNPKHNADIVKQLAVFAERKGCSLTQLALAWLLKQKDVFVIPGTRRVKYLEDNWKSATNVSLTDGEEAEIRAFAESVKIAGDPVPEGVASWYYLDSAELQD
ncbi:hypothetical protein NLU13_5720 [Sarocladium strictum]|uniref:NADP-dependent oxidoreductase domain-containing protein n=1 Tax=Sarocladium strictum TaxID=5046 RepID=A0AA39L7X6_SARSR|nr:hypothetical protein NLU13_5720 [Sarocladium strictum]